MQSSTRTKRCAALAVVALWLPLSLVTGQESGSQSEEDDGIWAEVVRLYEKAKETGGQVPKDVYEWLKEDLENIGVWEYRVTEIESPDAATLEASLDAMGLERWECIFVQPVGSRTRLIMKRPKRSFLRHLPASALLKLIPTGADSSIAE